MRPLRNERVTIGEGAAAFDLAGVEDHRSGLYSRGPGFWGPPGRIFAPAEITELVIRRQVR